MEAGERVVMALEYSRECGGDAKWSRSYLKSIWLRVTPPVIQGFFWVVDCQSKCDTSCICNATSTSEYPYSPWIRQAPRAKRRGLATFPFLLLKSLHIFFQFHPRGISRAFLTHRLELVKCIPTGCSNSSMLN